MKSRPEFMRISKFAFLIYFKTALARQWAAMTPTKGRRWKSAWTTRFFLLLFITNNLTNRIFSYKGNTINWVAEVGKAPDTPDRVPEMMDTPPILLFVIDLGMFPVWECAFFIEQNSPLKRTAHFRTFLKMSRWTQLLVGTNFVRTN